MTEASSASRPKTVVVGAGLIGSYVGGLLARVLAAYAINDEEYPAVRIGMKAILVVVALASGVGEARALQPHDYIHSHATIAPRIRDRQHRPG